MAVKKSATKAAKATTASKTAAKKAPAKKAAAKKAPAKKAAADEAVKATGAAKKATVKKAAASKPADKAPAEKPAKAVKAAKKAPVAKKAAKSKTAATPAVSKPAAPTKSARPSGKRPTGKVAVARVAKPSIPVKKGKGKEVSFKTDEETGRPILPKGYAPSADEEYMNPLHLEFFRQRLLQWRADLVEESKQTLESLKEEVRDIGDEAERATRETENALELRTRDRYRKLIGKIDSTLRRVDEGDYGYSVDSGEEIGLERLQVRLTAERTIDEQERWEHLQKQMGD